MRNCKVIAVTNQKGGVGKTTTTENVAIGLARNGCNVLIVDFDPQGDLTSCLGWKNNDSLEHSVSSMLDDYINDNDINYESLILHHEEHVDLIPANIELADFEMRLVSVINREQTLSNCIEPLRNQYDYIFIDCPPSLGMFTVNALSAATFKIRLNMQMDMNYLMNGEYKMLKGKRVQMIDEKMDSINKSFAIIHQTALLKAGIYCNEKEYSAMAASLDEYSNFIATNISNNAKYLSQFDHSDNGTDQGVWETRATLKFDTGSLKQLEQKEKVLYLGISSD